MTHEQRDLHARLTGTFGCGGLHSAESGRTFVPVQRHAQALDPKCASCALPASQGMLASSCDTADTTLMQGLNFFVQQLSAVVCSC
jgi:hypothetical protein